MSEPIEHPSCTPVVHGFYLTIPGSPPAKANQYRIVRYGKRYGLAVAPECAAYEEVVKRSATRLVQQLRIPAPLIPRALDLELWVIWHRDPRGTRRRDVDNILKALQDGLSGLLWEDDCQVSDLHARRVADARDGEWVEIVVRGGAPVPAQRPRRARVAAQNTVARAAPF